eukprot:3454425-Pleurochrysis_carterae.AAC.1
MWHALRVPCETRGKAARAPTERSREALNTSAPRRPCTPESSRRPSWQSNRAAGNATDRALSRGFVRGMAGDVRSRCQRCGQRAS